jgi:multidrug efflux pump subunit AcrA (membrane-fusion protein)
MSATVRLRYKMEGSTGSALSVPVSAIYTDPSGAQVAWIIDQDLIARRTPVKVGAVSAGSIEILEGLKAGDRIATAGVSLLRDGLKVRDLGDALGRNGR